LNSGTLKGSTDSEANVWPAVILPSAFQLKAGADRLSTALSLAAKGKASLLTRRGAGYQQAGQMVSEADAITAYLNAHSATH
jgi:hypothetical protein